VGSASGPRETIDLRASVGVEFLPSALVLAFEQLDLREILLAPLEVSEIPAVGTERRRPSCSALVAMPPTPRSRVRPPSSWAE
jgi:hypothetical protein